MSLLCDANDGRVVAGSLKVMNNSHYLPIWWMAAVLTVALTFEAVTERWTRAIESGSTICCLMLFWCVVSSQSVSNKWENAQLFLLALIQLAAENQNKNVTSVIARLFHEGDFGFLTAEAGDEHIKAHQTKKCFIKSFIKTLQVI